MRSHAILTETMQKMKMGNLKSSCPFSNWCAISDVSGHWSESISVPYGRSEQSNATTDSEEQKHEEK